MVELVWVAFVLSLPNFQVILFWDKDCVAEEDELVGDYQLR